MFHHMASGVNGRGRLALDAFKPLISDADGRLVNGSLFSRLTFDLAILPQAHCILASLVLLNHVKPQLCS